MSNQEPLRTQRELPKEPGQGTVLQNRYRLQRLLGAGGMGHAWLAEDSMRRIDGGAAQVVVKLLPPDLRRNVDANNDFRREYGKVWLLSHPHICKLFDMGEDRAAGCFQVMQYLPGATLRDLLRSQRESVGLAVDAVLPIVQACGSALDYAHGQRVLHRDVKPENVMCLPDGQQVFLIDFGLAAEIRSSQSRYSRGQIARSGTDMYMAPEQWHGQIQTAPCDQWALGILAWELLTGQTPFQGSGMALGFAICQAAVPALPEPLRALQPVFERVLQKDPGARYGSCQEFVTSLQRAAGGAGPVVVPAAAVHSDLAGLLERLQAAVLAAHQQARQFLAAHRYPEAVASLEQIPEKHRHLLDAELYQRCVDCQNEVQSLEQDIEASVDGLRFEGLRQKVQRLQELLPWRTDLAPLLQRIPESPVSAAATRDRGRRRSTRSDDSGLLLVAPFSAAAAKAAQGAAAGRLGRAEEWANKLGMKFRVIPAGTFLMGSPDDQGDDGEHPQHKVTITKCFGLGLHTVTQGQWQKLMGTTPWKGQLYVKEGAAIAATYVSWNDAISFCQRLSQQEGVRYRLPTEAEWEWSCRAGTTTEYSFGDDEKQLGQYAWFDGNVEFNDEAGAQQVGQKSVNPFGLYDLHGNVWEWCQDWWDSDYYAESPVENPEGASSGSSRVLRGGSWDFVSAFLRSASRRDNSPDFRSYYIGFRVVCELE
jgi:formylglycine-generating enzyme required for sulfatase activity